MLVLKYLGFSVTVKFRASMFGKYVLRLNFSPEHAYFVRVSFFISFSVTNV